DISTVIGVEIWGQMEDAIFKQLKEDYPNMNISQNNWGVIFVETTDSDLAELILDKYRDLADDLGGIVVGKIKTDSSYDDIAHLTLSEDNQGGSLPFKLGHEGFAVAFSSGLGDGYYPVYATIQD